MYVLGQEVNSVLNNTYNVKWLTLALSKLLGTLQTLK